MLCGIQQLSPSASSQNGIPLRDAETTQNHGIVIGALIIEPDLTMAALPFLDDGVDETAHLAAGCKAKRIQRQCDSDGETVINLRQLDLVDREIP